MIWAGNGKPETFAERLLFGLAFGLLGRGKICSARDDAYCSPSIVDADIAGTVACWRFHPSILAIIKSVFNPREGSLFGGNFGCWNFVGAGPDSSPRPFRLDQVGSVLSCPGSGDQAIHADTPHLLTHRLPPVSLFERFHPRLSRRRRSCQRMPPKRIRGRNVDWKFHHGRDRLCSRQSQVECIGLAAIRG